MNHTISSLLVLALIVFGFGLAVTSLPAVDLSRGDFNLAGVGQGLGESGGSGVGQAVPLHGWAWSSNIGWLSFNCAETESCDTVNYLVKLLGDNNFSGYAWNDNVGWVQFNPGLTGPANSHDRWGAKLESDGQVTGWALALTGTNEDDGWDGWISFSDPNGNYGVREEVSGDTRYLRGFAWAGDVFGWLALDTNYSDVTIGEPPDGGDFIALCSSNHPDGAYEGETIEWTISASGGSGNYDYCWGDVCVPARGGDVHSDEQITQTTMGTSDQTGEGRATDLDSGETADCEATVVYEPDQQEEFNLTINIFGSGKVETDDGHTCQEGSDPCQYVYDNGAVVDLTAVPVDDGQPDTDWIFLRWEGSCAGEPEICTVEMTENRTETAYFDCVGDGCPHGTLELVADTWPIEINTHNSGQWSARAANEDGGPGVVFASGGPVSDIEVRSIVSVTRPDCNILDIAGDTGPCGHSGSAPLDIPQCALVHGGTDDGLPDWGPGGDFHNCNEVPAIGLYTGDEARFSIYLPERGSRFNQYSPYNVTLGNDLGVDVSALFYYNVGDIDEY